jgi:uncharacterized protein with FMN-binding domain
VWWSNHGGQDRHARDSLYNLASMKKRAADSASGASKRVSHGLVALSSAAVLTVYGAGYVRTRAAAARFEAPAGGRRSGERPAPAARPPLASVATVASSPLITAPAPRAIDAPSPPLDAAPRPAGSARASAPAAAPAPIAPTAPAAPVAASAPTYDPSEEPFVFHGSFKQDGTFLGWGYSRHGDIQASVEIQNGRIVSAAIAQCLTRYSCDVIDKLPPQVIARQSAEVDHVSGATESADAFYDAVIDALSKAK